MKVIAHHSIHFGRKQSARGVDSPHNIFLIFSSLEANLQQRKKLKNIKLNLNLQQNQVARPCNYWHSPGRSSAALPSAGKLWRGLHSGFTLQQRLCLSSQLLPRSSTWKRPSSCSWYGPCSVTGIFVTSGMSHSHARSYITYLWVEN